MAEMDNDVKHELSTDSEKSTTFKGEIPTGKRCDLLLTDVQIGRDIEVKPTVDDLTDEYHYLKSGEYTSEIFKVVVHNIPKLISFGVSIYIFICVSVSVCFRLLQDGFF